MKRSSATRIVIQFLITVGIVLTLLLGGGAPSDNTHGPTVETPTPTP